MEMLAKQGEEIAMSNHRDMFVGMDQDAQFVRELGKSKDAAKEATEAMSKQVELPEMDVNLEDLEMSRKQDKLRKHVCRDALLLSIYCRERQFREALTQIATLTKQVEGQRAELTTVRGAMASQDSREVVAGMRCGVFYSDHGCDWPDAVAEEVSALKAELAALREGAKVTYRVEGLSSNQVWYATESAKTPSEARLWIEQRKAMPFPYCEYRVAEVTVITRERILGADGGEG